MATNYIKNKKVKFLNNTAQINRTFFENVIISTSEIGIIEDWYSDKVETASVKFDRFTKPVLCLKKDLQIIK